MTVSNVRAWFVAVVLVSVALSGYFLKICKVLGDQETIVDSPPVDSLPKGRQKREQGQEQHFSQAPYKHDFSYDRGRWYENFSERRVILVGPHKTGSSSLQDFLVNLLGSTVSVPHWEGRGKQQGSGHENDNDNDKPDIANAATLYTPHPSIRNWVWPVEIRTEYETYMANTSHAIPNRSRKFYAILAAYVTGTKVETFFKHMHKAVGDPLRGTIPEGQPASDYLVSGYFRQLLGRAWNNSEKQIVIAAEGFDAIVVGLANERHDASRRVSTTADSEKRNGEDLHVADDAPGMIDRLLDVLPFDHATSLQRKYSFTEFHIHYRTPRVGHLISIWHEQARGHTLREFLQNPEKRKLCLYQSNSLGLALQFARTGIRTTLVDMAGVLEKQSSLEIPSDRASKGPGNKTHTAAIDDEDAFTVIAGLQGVVACDVLRLTHLCDEHSRLYLQGYNRSVEYENKKRDRLSRDLTEEQLSEMDRVLEEYDCGVWRHLQKYQSRGSLRFLYPSKNLLSNCNFRETNEEDLSFLDAMKKVTEIASRDNGIPFRTKRMKVSGPGSRWWKNGKQSKKAKRLAKDTVIDEAMANLPSR